MPKILVLGGRLSGLTFAYTLKRLVGNVADVKLVDRYNVTHFRPAIPHIGIGIKEPEDIAVLLKDALGRKGIEFEQGQVTEIMPDENKVKLKDADGKSYDESYDYLAVALGAHLAKEKVKGGQEYAYSLCEIEDELKIREKEADFKGGNITIGSGIFYQGSNPKPKMPENFYPKIDSACEGPIFEMSVMQHGLLLRRGVLKNTKITVYSPASYLSDLSVHARNIAKALYEKLGIELIENFKVKEFTEDSVISEDGQTVKSDISFWKPPYAGRDLLENLQGDLADDGNFIPTDLNMVSLNYDNIYATGDINSGLVPKLGVLAVKMGRVGAEHLSNELGVSVEVEKYEPMVTCIADDPYEGYGIEVEDNGLYGGSVSNVDPSPLGHLKKNLLTKYYVWTGGDMVLERYFAAW
jgi:sulfide:quinone oxidoreductase